MLVKVYKIRINRDKPIPLQSRMSQTVRLFIDYAHMIEVRHILMYRVCPGIV